MSIINDILRGNKAILCDGAMGTALLAAGIEPSQCFETLNLSQPDLIQGIHADFITAGSRLILTHTFGANRLRLQAHGLVDKQQMLIQAAVANACAARKSCGIEPILIFGDIGPSGLPAAEIASHAAILRQDFADTCRHLLLAKIDGLWLETFTSLAEIQIAVQGLADSEKAAVPVIVTISPHPDGNLADGTPASVWMSALNELPISALGFNCVAPEMGKGQLWQRWQEISTKPLVFKPHAGLPSAPLSPEAFALVLKTCLERGSARFLGGCCGSTSRHIQAIADILTQTV
jgi:homocysteine S-methyltransferase